MCKFEHIETTGKLTSLRVGLCPLPLFNRLGQHVLWISDDDGKTFNFYTVLNIGKDLCINYTQCSCMHLSVPANWKLEVKPSNAL